MSQERLINGLKWGLLGLLGVAIVALAFTVGLTVGENGAGNAQSANTSTNNSPPTNSQTSQSDFRILDQILEILKKNHVDRDLIDPELMRLGAINGVIQQLNDPHTTYIDPINFACGTDVLSGAYEGIGAQVESGAQGEIVIVAPFDGSPAAKAGIQPGDIVLEVDGESTEGWTLQQAVCRIRGTTGEPVTLKVLHTSGKEETITIVRDRIVVTSVRMIDITDADGTPVNDLAYISLQQFTERTPQELQQVLRQINPSNTKGIIIDVRVNPGGLLNSTVQATDLFLDDGIILTEVDADGNEQVFRARNGKATDLPIVILVGQGSASGAEVFAAALRDNGRATLIGQSTFGKGSVNNLFNLSDGGAIYVTIARWLTPQGDLIEGLGVAPDIEVAASQEDIDQQRDVQLYRAIDFLRGQAASNPSSTSGQ